MVGAVELGVGAVRVSGGLWESSQACTQSTTPLLAFLLPCHSSSTALRRPENEPLTRGRNAALPVRVVGYRFLQRPPRRCLVYARMDDSQQALTSDFAQ